MARVKIEEIIDYLKPDIRKALVAAVEKTDPDCQLDQKLLFKNFKRAVRRKCGTWKRVPDRCVDQ